MHKEKKKDKLMQFKNRNVFKDHFVPLFSRRKAVSLDGGGTGRELFKVGMMVRTQLQTKWNFDRK